MEGPEISFVTFPDGGVADASLTVAGERFAKERAMRQWLPEDWFGELSYSAIESLWRGMQSKGFRVYTIKIGEDGQPSLKNP